MIEGIFFNLKNRVFWIFSSTMIESYSSSNLFEKTETKNSFQQKTSEHNPVRLTKRIVFQPFGYL